MRVLAIDIGASSGRAILGELRGDRIEFHEAYRFVNRPVFVDGALRWDFASIWRHVKEGVRRAAAAGGFDSIGIDTWGVDFGMTDGEGRLLAAPVCYRDARFERAAEEAESLIPRLMLYERTGVQFLPFNTIYQLYDAARRNPETLARAKTLLLLPDLLAYFLTGEMRTELTNASTTGLLNARTRQIDAVVCDKIGVSPTLFAPLIREGEIYGALKQELCAELGCRSVPVVAVCTHDTASAVAAVPTTEENFAFLSAGTWSLIGTERRTPRLDDPAFTNEIGQGGTVRYLKNCMGSWILQQFKEELSVAKEVGFAEIERMSDGVDNAVFIDVDDASFLAPGAMKPRIDSYLAKTAQKLPLGDAAYARCIYESLALRYAAILARLESTEHRKFARLHVFGGGIQARLLMRLCAGACGVPVVAGPQEATAAGNVAVQLIAAGELGSVAAARGILASDPDLSVYLPADSAAWREKKQSYDRLTEGNR